MEAKERSYARSILERLQDIRENYAVMAGPDVTIGYSQVSFNSAPVGA